MARNIWSERLQYCKLKAEFISSKKANILPFQNPDRISAGNIQQDGFEPVFNAVFIVLD